MPRSCMHGWICSLVVLVVLLAGPTYAQRHVVTLEGSDTGLPFSPAVWSGDLLYVSGAIANESGSLAIEGNITAQTKRVAANLGTVLEAAGVDMARVVSADMYLADLREFPAFWRALSGAMGRVPAGAVVEADMAIPNAKVEVALIAAKPGVSVRDVYPEGWPRGESGGNYATLAGNTLFISGMSGVDPEVGKLVGDDVGSQARQAMKNVGVVLAAADMGWNDVVRCRVFLPDARDYAAMNDAYADAVTDTPPARATVRARLLSPDSRFGVQCMAVKANDRRPVVAEGSKSSIRPFSPAIASDGRLYLAGMVGRGSDGWGSGIEAQTRITLDHLASTLKAAGLSFDDVVNATVYLTDVRHYQAMNKVYAEIVGSSPPARATVGQSLMSPDALVEIQMTADASDSPPQD